MSDARFKRAERRVAGMLGTRRTPLSGGNSRHTRSDTLHPDLFVEVKLAKSPPLWGEMLALRRRAARQGKRPLIVLTHPEQSLRLAILDLEDLVDFELTSDRGRIIDVLDAFQLHHISTRRSAWYTLLEDTQPKAKKEGKRALVVYKASGRPGEVAGFELTESWTLRGP